jgi:hypothetical protein
MREVENYLTNAVRSSKSTFFIHGAIHKKINATIVDHAQERQEIIWLNPMQIYTFSYDSRAVT